MPKKPDRALTRRNLLSMAATTGAGIGLAAISAGAATSPADVPARKPGQRSAIGLKHPPMSKVRVGIVGVGGRGMSLMGNLLDIANVQITAVCDIVPQKVEAAQKQVARKGQPAPAPFSKNETDFENLCKRDDIDVVYIASPWEWHTPMAVCAMNNGKHATIEVPAAITLDECWQLVDAAERTQRHCMMLENCCYGEIEMLVLNMCRQGLFGELTHGECGYIHPAAESILSTAPSSVWRRKHLMRLNGNVYPTHGLGPVAQYMGIHKGDRFERLVSMSSPSRSLAMLRDKLPADDPRRSERYLCGDMNTSLIQTARGRSIMVQCDMATPRVYSRINMICGTMAAFCDYPPRIHFRGTPEGWETDMAPYQQKHTHPLWKKLKETALKSGGHGGMDFVMNWRLVQCLLEGEALDMSVYDAAAWSSVMPLSVMSVAQGSAPVLVPDFTRGQWQNA